MWQFIRQMLQLLLQPARGWEDVSESAIPPADLQRRFFVPWAAIVAASQLLRMIFDSEFGFVTAIEAVILGGAAMAASLFLAHYGSCIVISQYVDEKVNRTKLHVIAIYMVAINGLFSIIANALPPSLNIVNILPLLSLLVLFNSTTFVGIQAEKRMQLFGFSALCFWLTPMLVEYILLLLI